MVQKSRSGFAIQLHRKDSRRHCEKHRIYLYQRPPIAQRPDWIPLAWSNLMNYFFLRSEPLTVPDTAVGYARPSAWDRSIFPSLNCSVGRCEASIILGFEIIPGFPVGYARPSACVRSMFPSLNCSVGRCEMSFILGFTASGNLIAVLGFEGDVGVFFSVTSGVTEGFSIVATLLDIGWTDVTFWAGVFDWEDGVGLRLSFRLCGTIDWDGGVGLYHIFVGVRDRPLDFVGDGDLLDERRKIPESRDDIGWTDGADSSSVDVG